MNIKKMLDNYQENGYEYIDAQAKVCQDIILIKLSRSKFSKNITIKGGVVMHSISADKRRESIFDSTNYRNKFNSPKVNWLNLSVGLAIKKVISYLESL